MINRDSQLFDFINHQKRKRFFFFFYLHWIFQNKFFFIGSYMKCVQLTFHFRPKQFFFLFKLRFALTVLRVSQHKLKRRKKICFFSRIDEHQQFFSFFNSDTKLLFCIFIFHLFFLLWITQVKFRNWYRISYTQKFSTSL